uniref:Homeobox domain-containing protein n=1 Tax=Physcomitrium patens TaxID=3218 RepID=A0A2K1JDT2_PHYPA|nr:hypothetical protein PHYPA_019970 [Physcomitrium patens]
MTKSVPLTSLIHGYAILRTDLDTLEPLQGIHWKSSRLIENRQSNGMESESRLGRMMDMTPLGSGLQGQPVPGGAALGLGPSLENSLPQPMYTRGSGQVMTEEQLETLRRQISVYATICQQLVEMHKASVSQQASLPGILASGQIVSMDHLTGTPPHKSTARQRWTPSQHQLQILEKLFEQGSGTPNKQRIKEITAELSQHGAISETNVYNWFQNRKARAKRKQQLVTPRDGESEADTDVESPKEKRTRQEGEQNQDESGGVGDTNGGGNSDGAGNGVPEQRAANFDQQDAASSALLHSQTDTKPDISSFNRSAGFDPHNVSQGIPPMMS